MLMNMEKAMGAGYRDAKKSFESLDSILVKREQLRRVIEEKKKKKDKG